MSDVPPAGFDITYDERAILLGDTLVLSDLHLGKTSTRKFDFPTPEYDDIRDRFSALLDRFEPEIVVLAGDVFNSFDQPPDEAVQTLADLQSKVESVDGELIITPGNHDTYKFDIQHHFTGRVKNEYAVGNVCILHGHNPPVESAELYVIGHLHPALEHAGTRWPCFLYADDAYNGASVLILPQFTKTTNGTPINNISSPLRLDLPLIDNGDKRIEEFHPLVFDDELDDVRVFPEFRHL